MRTRSVDWISERGPTFGSHDRLWHHGGRLPEHFVRHSREVAEFVGQTPEPILDLGEDNPKIRIVSEVRGFTYTSCSDVDFDHEPIPGTWGTIFCLEILEHLYNPLLALENMKRALGPGGVIYLSTPRRPHYLWFEEHFHEIDDRRIGWLFQRAGLCAVRRRLGARQDLRFHFSGIRPFLRLFTSTRIYELRPTDPR